MPWRENKGVCQFRGNLDGCFGVAYGKMFWSSEDRVRARFQYAESRQKITYGVNLNENLKKNL